MELKFIWTEKFRTIQNLGFNFNHEGEHKFEYKDNNIILHPNRKSILDFGSNVTGITVIAGENGSGKSTLCELALLSTATLNKGSFGFRVPFNGIVCFGDTIFYHKKLSIDNLAFLKSSGYQIVSFKNSPFEEMDHDWMDYFERDGFIYYSNILDQRSYFDENNLTNISTQFLAYEGDKFGPYYSNYPRPEWFDERKDRIDSFTLFERAESHRSVLYYLYFRPFIPFKGPTTFVYISTYPGNNRFLSIDKASRNSRSDYLFEIQQNIFDSICNRFYSAADHELKVVLKSSTLKTVVHRIYKLNTLFLFYRLYRKLPDEKQIYEFVFNDQWDVAFLNEFPVAKLIQLHSSVISNIIDDDYDFNPYFLQERYNHFTDWRFILIERVYLKNTMRNCKALRDLIELEEAIFKYDRILPFSLSRLSYYPRFSAGENAFYSLFSRIFEVLRRTPDKVEKNKITLLFIDEAEIGFHPQWQKAYLKNLLTFLNSFGQKFQLILTTHSPYLLSDLTSDNIILLRKDEDGNTAIVPSDQYKTFGANIHELLATSFFLRDGLMGEFAKKKIEDLVEFFNSDNQLFDQSSAKELIDSIGDDIISARLMDMYDERFRTKDQFISTEDYRSWLQSELKRLNLTENDLDFEN